MMVSCHHSHPATTTTSRYKCEICGNMSYWGRRAFDRHFQEWRHAYGMRCLKIPNTKHFHDITLIEVSP